MKIGMTLLLLAGSLVAAPPPAFEQYCFKCHDATQAEGDLDLEGFVTKTSDIASVATLEDIMVRIAEGDMPPKKSRKQPDASQKEEIIAWAQGQLDAMAEASMDDPGLVVMPRLTRHEYHNVIRDLSGGIVLKGGEYLPNEGGAGEGFSNVGEAQGMGMAQFEKYLEAAKGALKHLRVSPHDGLVWSAVPHEPVDEPKQAIKEATDDILAWYLAQQQKWGAEHHWTGPGYYGWQHAPYLEAAKRDTDTLVCSGVSVSLSPVALAKWSRILNDTDPKSPFADWAKAWRAIPASGITRFPADGFKVWYFP